VHPTVHARESTMATVGRGEYRAEYDQSGESERPESQESAESAQIPLGTLGQVPHEIAGDGQRGRRKQR
jgi:hypothetical protein